MLHRAQAEEEGWKKVSYEYDAHVKKLEASLEKRSADLQIELPGSSAKAKGKRRATGNLAESESDSFLHEHLTPEFHSALALAKSVLGVQSTENNRVVGGGSRRGVTKSGKDREELDRETQQLMLGLEYETDQIYAWTCAARVATNIAERMLDERFRILSANLTSRVNPFPSSGEPPPAGGSGSSTTQLLSTYVAPARAKSIGPDPLDLMRALSRVDQKRPPAQVGDAARRAAREVQRAGESGYAGSVGGEKRLTNVPSTPRKIPGTPRRGNTPARGSTPGR